MIPRPVVSRRSKVLAWVCGLLALGNCVYPIYLKGEGLTHIAVRNPPAESLRFMALSEVDLENLGRSAELARKAVGEAPFRVTLIGANGQTAATSVMRVT
jgi:hypothetical protein